MKAKTWRNVWFIAWFFIGGIIALILRAFADVSTMALFSLTNNARLTALLVGVIFGALPWIFVVVGFLNIWRKYKRKLRTEQDFAGEPIVHLDKRSTQEDWIKRRQKVWKMTDRQALMEIAKNDPDKNVREAAESRLQDLSDD